MENKLQNLKFRVYSEEHSKAIQEKLLEIGYDFKPRLFDKACLFIEANSELSWHWCDSVFLNEHKYTICTLDDLYRIQKELDKVKEEISKLNK